MIDLFGVLTNSLWILALAALLALLSWSSWQAQCEGVRFRVVWARPAIQNWVAGSLMLFCISMAALSDRVWERWLWALLALAWLVQPLHGLWMRKRQARSMPRAEETDYALSKGEGPEDAYPTESFDPAVNRFPANINWRIALRWGLGLLACVLAVGLLVRDLDWHALLSALRSADYRWVAAAVLITLAGYATRVWRWQVLLWHTPISWGAALRALLVGQVLNTALPLRSGDVARALWVRAEHGSGATEALGTIALEKLWDLLALVGCGVMLLLWIPLPEWFAESTWGVGITFLIGIAVLGVGVWQQETLLRWAAVLLRYIPPRWNARLLPKLQQLAASLESVRQPKLAARAALWTLLTWGLYALANQLILIAFGSPSLPAACFLLVTLMVGGTVPVPGRLGIYEGIAVVSLAVFGFPADQALAVGLVLHLVALATPLITLALLFCGNGSHLRLLRKGYK